MNFQKVEIHNDEEDASKILTKKRKNRCLLVLLLSIPILIISYFIFRKKNIAIINSKYIIKPLTDKNSYKIIRLPNGLEAALVSDPLTPMSSASLLVKAGCFYDKVPGLAHFCEHMLFLGNKNYPEDKLYENILAKHSGKFNAFTSLEYTDYFFQIDNNGFKEIFPVYSSMFNQPLFDSKFIEKEINAVNSEHDKNKNNDNWIVFDLIKKQGNVKHPYNQFATGNNETLKSVSTDELREKLVDYFEMFYTLDNMKLAVISNYTIDEIEKMVTKSFSFNHNKTSQSTKEKFDDKIKALKNEKPFNYTTDFKKIIWYNTASGTNKMHLFFNIKSIDKQYKTKPWEYLNLHINSKGEKSLIKVLKDKGLIIDLIGKIEDDYSVFANYLITVVLTNEGVEHYDLIIKLVFNYIKILKNEENINIEYFLESKKNNDILFKFKSKKEPSEQGIDLTYSMLKYDYYYILSGNYMITELDSDMIKEFLKEISIDKSIIILSTEKNLTNTKLFEKSERKNLQYYNRDYFKANISEEFYKSLSDKPIEIKDVKYFPEGIKDIFGLKGKNNFITNERKLITPCYEKKKKQKCTKDNNPNNEYIPTLDNIEPVNISNDSKLITAYYKIDNSFQIPQNNLIIKISSKEFLTSKEDFYINEVMLFQYFKIIEQSYLYDATSLNQIHFSLTNEGIILNINSFYDITEKIIDKIMTKLTNQTVDNNTYSQIKDLTRFYLQQIQSLLAIQKNDLYFNKLISKDIFIMDDIKIVNIDNITLSAFNDYITKIKNTSIVKFLIHGYTNKNQSTNISKILESSMGEYNDQRNQAEFKQRIIPPKNIINFYYQNKYIGETNHATSIYYQMSQNSLKELLIATIFNKCIGKLFFQELRTRQQLGYIVRSGNIKAKNVLYYYIGVQGEKYYPDQVDDYINDVINISLSINCTSNFSELITATANEINMTDNNLNGRTTRIWNEIILGSLNWNKKKELMTILNEFKEYNEIHSYMKDVFIDNPKRLGIFNYANTMEEIDISKRISDINNNKKYSLNKEIEVIYTNKYEEMSSFNFFE